MEKKHYDVVIVGAGAAGLMSAATAGYRDRKVLIIEHANKVGKKILMSGGGRCNFTNLLVEPRHYLSANGHFCKSALSRYKSSDFIELVERHGLAYHEKTKGQLFCDNKAKDILDILLQECQWAGVEIRTRCSLDSIQKNDAGFALSTSIGELSCDSLVVATGGLSIPTMGASGKGYEIAQQFNIECTTREASLVPFTLSGKWKTLSEELSGLSLEVSVTCNGQKFSDPLLFTHRGLSGPAILQISNYWHNGNEITLDFLPEHNTETLIKKWQQEGSKAELKNLMAQYLPKRFIQQWLQLTAGNKAPTQYSEQEIQAIHRSIHQWVIVPPGTEGYRTAEVTRGGVNTDEISSKTFEAKKVKGLFFIGEVLDVTGWLGGYNFQWAWASGYCAGQYV